MSSSRAKGLITLNFILPSVNEEQNSGSTQNSQNFCFTYSSALSHLWRRSELKSSITLTYITVGLHRPSGQEVLYFYWMQSFVMLKQPLMGRKVRQLNTVHINTHYFPSSTSPKRSRLLRISIRIISFACIIFEAYLVPFIDFCSRQTQNTAVSIRHLFWHGIRYRISVSLRLWNPKSRLPGQLVQLWCSHYKHFEVAQTEIKTKHRLVEIHK